MEESIKVLGNDIVIDGPLGLGGFGSVYRGRQLSTGLDCAVKIAGTDPDTHLHLLREARILARLPTDHVPRLLRIGDARLDGVQWFATELLDGERLDGFVGAHGLGTAGSIGILLDICDALDAGHRRGIAHCNVKPGNILVRRGPHGALSAYLLGFGIATWSLGADPFEDASIGTLPWMAPEQLRSRRLVTPATDVWALGLVAFYLFTGHDYWLWRRPSRRPGPALDGLEDTPTEPDETLDDEDTPPVGAPSYPAHMITLLHDLLDGPLVAASERARQLGIRHELPGWFDEWFSRCVTRDLDRRFATAGSCAQALMEHQEAPLAQVPQPLPDPVDTFISYADRDMSFCDELLIHLSMMRRQGLINEWHERCVGPGSFVSEEISASLTRCSLFVALLSADYIASDKCYDLELKIAMERHRSRTGHLTQVVVRACDWAHPPFSHFRALPRNGVPLSSWKDRDAGWTEVIRDIRLMVEDLRRRRSSPSREPR